MRKSKHDNFLIHFRVHMTLRIDDLLGLNPVTLASMPIAFSETRLKALLQSPTTPVSLTGSRHSQGGHTVFPNAMAVLTEPMNRVTFVDYKNKTVTVEAGATWNVLHAYLAPLGLAPRVQQSSPHFTIGGSISVNCHGRDPSQGPLANCIVSMKVLVPSSTLPQPMTVTPEHPLFKAIVGGYGSAAVVLTVTLHVTENHMLTQQAKKLSLAAYAKKIQQHQSTGLWPELHYGWLNFSKNNLFETVLAVDCIRPSNSLVVQENKLNEDGWPEIELMRWLWEQHGQADKPHDTSKTTGQSWLDKLKSMFSDSPNTRDLIWDAVVSFFLSQNLENDNQGKQLSRINWLRQSIAFTAHRSETHVDLLQEYFVPIERFQEFVEKLGKLITKHHVNLLSSTVRVVQKEHIKTHLSYAPDQAMACIALDFETPLVSGPSQQNKIPSPSTFAWVREAIDLANSHQGNYYLPYYGFATIDQFKRAYKNWPDQKNAKDLALNNLFADTYLK